MVNTVKEFVRRAAMASIHPFYLRIPTGPVSEISASMLT